MLMQTQRTLVVWICGFAAALCACQTPIHTSMGIQPDFEGINPAAIIAIPTFTVPDPSSPNAAIDPAILSGDRVISKVEEAVLRSFSNQPNIHGYSFSAISKIIKNSPHELSTKKPEVPKTNTAKQNPALWNRMYTTVKSVSAKMSSLDIRDRLSVTSACSTMENMVDFYVNCLLPDKSWLPLLNALSAQAFHADSALFVFVDDLRSDVEKKNKKETYSNYFSVSVMLVDTNNGKLMWSRHRKNTASNNNPSMGFPSWEKLIDNTINEDFWTGFPGRLVRQEENKK